MDEENNAQSPDRQGRMVRIGLGMLLLTNFLNFFDRQIISILAEPIKHDLNLSDSQLGLLTGLAFAMLYTILGLPIARWSERGDRRLIISVALMVWSGFTLLSGLVRSYAQLLICRVGVGIGEAGCGPPALSLISEYTPRHRRAMAMAIFMLGAPLGGLAGMSIGGIVASTLGWRSALLIAGAPGVVLAVLLLFVLVEPRRALGPVSLDPAPSWREALHELAAKRSYWFIIFGISLKAFISYGMTAFLGSFFLRNHGPELAALAAGAGLRPMGFTGIALGLITGGMGVFGTLAGGAIADRFGRRDIRAYADIPALAVLFSTPFFLIGLSTDSAVLALAMLAVTGLLNTMWYGPAYSAIQSLVQPRTRATSAAVMMFVSNLVGLGIGPLGIGLVSDLIASSGGLGAAAGLRWSLMIFVMLSLPCAALFWAARRTLRDELVS
jgi:MFS family permease